MASGIQGDKSTVREAFVEFRQYVHDIGDVAGQRRVLLCVAGRRIRLTGTDIGDEKQAKVPVPTLDDETPKPPAESVSKDRWTVWGANHLDVVPGVDVHCSSLSRCCARTRDSG
jgi:hypothetical protein